MQKVLGEIQSGEFHKEWIKEYNDGYPQLERLRNDEKELTIEEISRYMLKELFGCK